MTTCIAQWLTLTANVIILVSLIRIFRTVKTLARQRDEALSALRTRGGPTAYGRRQL